MVRFFRCEKCGYQFIASDALTRDRFKCGAVVQYLPAENEGKQEGPIGCLGLKPIGCGGIVKEINQEEAMSYEPKT